MSNSNLFLLGVVAVLGGLASMVHSIKHARTSDDGSTGTWFMVGVVLFVVGMLAVVGSFYSFAS